MTTYLSNPTTPEGKPRPSKDGRGKLFFSWGVVYVKSCCTFVPQSSTKHKHYHAMSTVSKSQIIEDAKFTTKFGESIHIGFVKKFSEVAEVFINPNHVSRHKTVRKIYNIDELVQRMNDGKPLGY